MKPIRVGYVAGEPSPWRSPHLDRIAARPEIDLTVIYAAETVQRREWSVTARHRTITLRGPRLPATRVLHHDYPVTPQIWNVLRDERFDVLVIGGWALLAAQLAIVWARAHRVPYLIVAENHLGETRPLWVRGLKRAVLRFVIPSAAGNLVPGTLGREHALHYGADPQTVTIFPNTIDVPAYRREAEQRVTGRRSMRAELGLAAEAVVVLYVGRMLPEKGPRDLVEAIARASRATNKRLQVLLVGDGPFRKELERRAVGLGVDAVFTGFRQGDALLDCYAAADIFALLSHRETWGIVVNEAASFALPLILTDAVGAAADLLRPGENGLLVPVGDVEAQAQAVAQLAADDELRHRCGARSVELVEPWGYAPSVDAFVAAVRRATTASSSGSSIRSR